ncbi:MAG: MarR family transcriptional regulator [Thermomicrobiales bacterium]|nr:MarR family transcriptional regulator [Thermomicrobiales bacterium]
MRFPECPEALACARLTLALLPPLRQWVSGRVQQAGACEGISLRQFAALRSIQDGAQSPGEIARLWRVTPAVITGVLDRLERRDLVRREPDPVDRRRLRLALTAQGEQIGHNVDQALTGVLAQQLATRTPQELAELERSLRLLDSVFRELETETSSPAALPADDMPCWDDDATASPALASAAGNRVDLNRVAPID